MRRALTALAGLVGATLLLGLGLAQPSQASASADPARILIIGDSVTHGRVGDYTWRYRLWNQLASEHANVDFVGPAHGVFNTDTQADDPAGYADPAFDGDHAAWSGSTLMFPHWDLERLVADYRPDVVINDLGINDLCFDATPDQLVSMMGQFVAQVRAVRPHATVVLGQMTQRWLCDADEYNTKLLAVAAAQDVPTARVIVAIAPTDYVEGVDTWDTRHPSASGEVKIADQFDHALAGIIPAVHIPDTYAAAARLKAQVGKRAVRLTFTRPAEASGEVIWMRNLTGHGRWHPVVWTGGDRHRVAALRTHHRYAFKVQAQAYGGLLTSTTFSNVVKVRTR
jgi:lysophospholipase L1-like esterase